MLRSVTVLVLRFIAWALLAAGMVSAEVAEFLVTDPDVAIVANGVLGVVAAEGIAWLYRKGVRPKDATDIHNS